MASQELSLAYMVLPPSILDWFGIVKVDEQITDTTGKEVFVGIIHIYLDESDNRTSETAHLRPNDFTEETKVSDFPIRDRKVLLHIRRRRWLDSEGKNVIISTYPLVEQGTRYSPEFAAFLKETAGYDPDNGESIVKALGGVTAGISKGRTRIGSVISTSGNSLTMLRNGCFCRTTSA